MAESSQAIRQPAVAGQFYPAVPDKLRATVGSFIPSSSAAPVPGLVRALIVPHAGYQYSGATAGHAYALLRQRPDIRRVLVIAPAHRVYFTGISTGSYDVFKTPLGSMAVATEACRGLVDSSDLFTDDNSPHQDEHALEVQLPFLQTVLGDFTLIPLVCGQLEPAEIVSAGKLLAEQLWQPDTLWIISSDFTHYGVGFDYLPFTQEVPRRLEELDRGAIRYIEETDLEGFRQYVERTGATICGARPIALLLAALNQVAAMENNECRLISYTSSGKMTHDYRHSVSYASLAVIQPRAETVDAREPGGNGFPIELQRSLLTLAREVIGARLAGTKIVMPDPKQLPELLRRPGASFVTLHLDGALRGCIGNLAAEEPLYMNVIHNARKAAFQDPRFRPLTADEFARVRLEISVLSEPVPIASLDEFIVGKHGIILEKGRARSVFLPQVAPEQGWDRETTAEYLALKAGLDRDAWRRGAKFYVFTAVVFGDDD